MDYVDQFLQDAREIIDRIDRGRIRDLLEKLKDVRRKKGRIFFLGVGGSAANASHAVNDFRKICGFEAYTPVDNVSELSARINDDGWESVFVKWLEESRLSPDDAVFIFSVGGGDEEKNVSVNLIRAIEHARTVGAKVLGIVGRDGGYTARAADACVVVPSVNPAAITPHAEAFQAVIWHLLASHPEMKTCEMKWESQK